MLDLYDIAEREGIRFLNVNLPESHGATCRANGITFIYVATALNERQELIAVSHEMGHYFKDNLWRKNQKAAWEWAATYIISREDYLNVLNDPFVNSDYEAATTLRIPMKLFHIVKEYYKHKVFPVRQDESGIRYWQGIGTETFTKKTNEILSVPQNKKPPPIYVPHGIHRANPRIQYEIKHIKYDDYASVMKKTYITCDSEAAEALSVSTYNLRIERASFQSQGLPVRQCDFVTDWRDWYY